MWKDTEFKLTTDHIRLIRAMNIRWCDVEFGAPCVDPKRPYGNSDVVEDICEIMNWEFDPDEGPCEAQIVAANKLHSETQTALQILVQQGLLIPGTYTTKEYMNEWSLKK